MQIVTNKYPITDYWPKHDDNKKTEGGVLVKVGGVFEVLGVNAGGQMVLKHNSTGEFYCFNMFDFDFIFNSDGINL